MDPSPSDSSQAMELSQRLLMKPAFRPDAKSSAPPASKKAHVNPVGESSSGYSMRVLSKPGEKFEIAQKSIVPPIVKQGTAFNGKGSNAGATSDNSSLPSSVPALSATLVRHPEGNHQESLQAAIAAGQQSVSIPQSDKRNLLNVLHRLRQNPGSTEFVYLKSYRVNDSIPMNPYHLEVVGHEECENQFFTLSAYGVTHFVDGKPTFSDLDQWKREAYLFNAIIKIPIFNKFRLWKTLKMWRMTVRFGKISKCKRDLQKGLFMLNPTFQKALLEIRAKSVELNALRLSVLVQDDLRTLESFCSAQRSQTASMSSALTDFCTQCKHVVYGACQQSIDILENRMFSQTNSGDASSSAATGAGGGGDMKASEFKYTVMASKRVEHRRLFHFLLLCDYIMFSSLQFVVVQSVTDIAMFFELRNKTLESPESEDAAAPSSPSKTFGSKSSKKSIKSVFFTEVFASDSAMIIKPDLPNFETELELLNNNLFVESVGGLPRLTTSPDLKQFVELHDDVTNSDSSILVDIVKTDATFERSCVSIMRCVQNAFDAVNTYMTGFEAFRLMMISNASVDADALRVSAESGTMTLEEFREKFILFGDQKRKIGQIASEKDIGIIRVDASVFKSLIAPSPMACLEKIENVLPGLAQRKQKSLLEEVNRANAKMGTKPNTPSEFVEVLLLVDKLIEDKDILQARMDDVDAHYRLLNEQDVPIPELDRASYSMLVPEYRTLQNNLELQLSLKDENVVIWAKELEKEIIVFQEKVGEVKVLAGDGQILEEAEFYDPVIQQCEELKEKTNELEDWAKSIVRNQAMFAVPSQRFAELDDLVADVNLKLGMWSSLKELESVTKGWVNTVLDQLEVSHMETCVTKWFKTAMRADRELPPNKVAPALKDQAQRFKDLTPIVSALRNPSLQQRHWDKIESVLGHKLERDPETWSRPFTLGVLLEMRADLHQEKIEAISTEATQESSLETLLKKVQDIWSTAEFVLALFKDQKDVYILAGVDELQVYLDDSMVTMGTIQASRYVAGIRDAVDKMELSLRTFSDTLDEWLNLQRNWMYLEPIFSSPDIAKQLPADSKSFNDVDKNWKALMKACSENPNALRNGTKPNLLASLTAWNESLDRVQKNLDDYLEKKRNEFPRFFFLSNEELLEILAQTKNVQAVQPHMSKCFDGIKALDFGSERESIDIFAMISPENEYVSLLGINDATKFGKKSSTGVKARGNVESWLGDVERAMADSLRRLSKHALADYLEKARKSWVLLHAAQVIIMVAGVYWCKEGQAALRSKDPASELVEWKAKVISQLNDLCALVRTDLKPLDRMKLVALITLEVHYRDICETLIETNVTKEADFGWQMLPRYYWDETRTLNGLEGDCQIRQVQAEFWYAYEYLGASMRLVVTPLTDRCYMTLTGALHLKLGGAPAGPAGTGKTETTKDLAKLLARQCIVFNCGDNLDYKFMGKFFKGLAQCGAWACFDEFNRINIEVLSVIAQQMICIQTALKQCVTKFRFEGSEIRLISTFGVFITMNPGYAGRTELPDNLKALFRPMSMMIPDYALVAEVMLFSEGFETARYLSRKMVKLYKLSSEQLSQQEHYDFGMRAVKSVLVMAGSLKRANPDMSEDIVLIRAMCDSNIPKFLRDDVILFEAIVQDLFPGTVIPPSENAELKDTIREVIGNAGLQITEEFMLKVVQLFETFSIRFGVMTVGPTGGGKSVVAHTLAASMTLLRERAPSVDWKPDIQTVRITTLNPKAINIAELYGNYNLLTNEWADGLGSTLIRDANNDTTEDRKWIVFDGPVDALWIESMNTVLDDNRTLCLPNGERIKLNGRCMRMLFEVEDLKVASPATVSRCGMVWVPSEALGWLPFVQTWANSRYSDPKVAYPGFVDQVVNMFDQHLPAAIKFLRTKCREPIASVDQNLIASMCSILSGILLPERSPGLKDAAFADVFKKIFMFAGCWSIGANIDSASKEKFDVFVRDVWGDALGRFPNSGLVYDYYVDVHDNSFKPWTEICPKFEYDRTKSFFDVLVPTLDTVRYSYVMQLLSDVNRGALLIGESGTGKTAVVLDFLNKAAASGSVVPFVIAMSAQTSSSQTQEMMELRLEKKRKGVFGAPSGKKLVCFVDDVNMPLREFYGAQPPIELLRQVVDQHQPNVTFQTGSAYGGFYDRKKMAWQQIVDTTLFLACGPPGGGRNIVTARFFRHFTMMAVAPPSDAVLSTIFSSMLEGFLSIFHQDIKAVVGPTVKSSIEVYRRMEKEMLPTPSKSHYTFNLRDLSKVFQGIMSTKPASIGKLDTFIMLWCHECMRVFMDRLISNEDKSWFTHLLHDLLKKSFSKELDHDATFSDSNKPIMFGDYMRPGLSPEDRAYEFIQEPSRLPKLFETYLDDFNSSSSKQMNLVFFMDAIEHISRICRVIRQPRGNALLVGLGGSGKQSLTRMASFMADTKLSQIELSRGYGANEFHEDIKKVCMMAGCEMKPVVFLFTDNQIVKESFVEDINGLLNAGDVPNLFAPDEKERVCAAVRPFAEKAGKPTSKDSLYAFFVDLVRSNLHLVLCMSPVGDAFRTRCRMFPALINCCTIDWYLEWPEVALLSVSSRFLEPIESLPNDQKQSLSKMCVVIHTSVASACEKFFHQLRRKYYTTPKSYLDLISLYTTVVGEKLLELSTQLERFKNGLKKMEETNAVIDKLQGELTLLKPVLAEKSAATKVLLQQVAIDEAEANKVKEVVASETILVEAQTKDVMIIQADAQKDLDEALPALDNAVAALNSLTKGDITEVKGFAKPPALVQVTMEAVCTLLGEKPDWDSAKKVLSDSSFMQKLLTYDKDNIPPKILKALQKYIQNPDFNAENVGKTSKAAKGLCMWCCAMDVYSRVAKEVEPKRLKLAEANASLAAAQSALQEKQDALAVVEAKVAELQRQLKQAQDDQKTLLEQSALCEGRLTRAGVLTNALGDEAVRWGETTLVLQEKLRRLVGDAFLACSCVSYYGAFTGSYREELVASWIETCKELDIPVSDDFTLRGVLASPVELRDWANFGLPTDAVSIDNGVLVTRGRRWPLMIDPQLQANRWIRSMEEKKGLKFVKLTDPNFLRSMETCIRIGSSVLLEDVMEELDPALEPILLKQLFKSGGRTLIRLGDSDVDYDSNFRFYMTSKMPNPHYLPEICIKTTIINFTVTKKGLEDQLLGDVVRKERPDLEQQKDKLVVSMAADKKQLKELEDKVLKLLKESEGNILDNKPLIATLEQSKITSTAIGVRVKESEETEIKINEAREKYRSAANRGSILYFVIADLATIDPMYQYSLNYFQRLYNYCIDSSEKSSDLQQRLTILINFVTDFMYQMVCRGLFEAHKGIYSLLIATAIQMGEGAVSFPEWNFLLRSGKPSVEVTNPDPLLFNPLVWNLIIAAQTDVPCFSGLCDHISKNLKEWKLWKEQDDPQDKPFPEPWNSSLSPFQRMLLIKIFREEKFVFAQVNYIRDTIGRQYTENPPFSLGDVFKDSNHYSPIIFVLSTGADPLAGLMRFAAEKDFSDKLEIISLGQGQGPIAEKAIAQATKNGKWICLMNCHLATSWMMPMEKLIEGFSSPTADIHPDFRLWLTSMPSTTFPVSVLQNGIKITNEPPKGVRTNMLRSLSDMGDAAWEDTSKPKYWKKLMFSLVFFHAVIQERRKYGPLGWNIRYEFNNSDLECARLNLKMFIEDQAELPWEALLYVSGQINYGGRVTDDLDRRCLMCILNSYYLPSVVNTKDYKFSSSGTYYCPAESSLPAVLDYVRSFPITDDPELFGMHDNANISFQLQETLRIIDTVLSLQPRIVTAAGGKSPEDKVDELATEILENLPGKVLQSEAADGLFKLEPNGAYNCLDTVLIQESERYNRVLDTMRKTLGDLRKALKGLVVMSSDLEKMFTSMLNNQVPELWSKVGWLSTKTLASWVKDLDRRLKFMRDWMTTGTPKSFWLPGFFFPQGFMTGALQSHARRYKLPIDTLNFGLKILPIENVDDVQEAPTDGLYIDGLYAFLFIMIYFFRF